MTAPLPPDERERLQALWRQAILDTPPDAAFDRITKLAARLLKVSIAQVTLVDEHRQWIKSSCGLKAQEAPREWSFCAHAILTDQLTIVPDATRDPRFRDNPFVTGSPDIRFYAGAPLKSPEGFTLGTLCVIDKRPRGLSVEEQGILADLAVLTEDELNLRLALREVHERTTQLQTAVGNCKIPMMIFDENGQIRLLSQGWTTYSGYTLADIPTVRDWQAKALDKITGPANGTIDPSNPVLESETGEWAVRAKDGGQKTWNFFTTPFGQDHHGGARLLINEAIDITEQKRAEQALQELNRSLERRVSERTRALALKTAVLERSNADLAQFGSVASHDLQEPLRAVAGCVQMLERKYRGRLDSKADELIRMIVGGSARMKDLIDGLLAYASAGGTGSLEVIDTGAALQTALAGLSAAVRDSKAEVTHGDLPCLRFHPTQFEQILQNLIGNAVKYRDGKVPKIEVSAQRQEDAWLMSVADNGIGFDPQHAEKIFGVFQRLHTRDQHPGTGIGLAIVKKMVERRGGKIRAESIPGVGSTFTFSVPDQEPEWEVLVTP